MNRLKHRWGITSNFQLLVIFVVFAITGSASVYVGKPFLDWVGMDPSNFPDTWWGEWLYWSLRILIIFPIYQVLLVVFGWLFGQYQFFWNFEKKMLGRMGLGFLWKDETQPNP